MLQDHPTSSPVISLTGDSTVLEQASISPPTLTHVSVTTSSMPLLEWTTT